MKHKLLIYKSSQISYYRFGTGPSPVICFHGYGEDARGYAFLEQKAGDRFTFYSLDLPYHGKTEWNEGLNFSQRDLVEIIERIFNFENQKPETKNQKLIHISARSSDLL